MTGLVMVLALGTVWSLTQLVVADKITSGPRDALVDRLRRHRHRVTVRLGSDVQGNVAKCTCGWHVVAGGSSENPYVTVAPDGTRTRRPGRDLSLLADDHREYGPLTDPGKLAYLLTCPWCASFTVAVPVAVTAEMWGHTSWWQVTALAFTARVVAGLLVSRFGPHDA